jgi:hypothetical protein
MGYCNEYHFLRAQLQGAKERVKKLEDSLNNLEKKESLKILEKEEQNGRETKMEHNSTRN